MNFYRIVFFWITDLHLYLRSNVLSSSRLFRRTWVKNIILLTCFGKNPLLCTLYTHTEHKAIAFQYIISLWNYMRVSLKIIKLIKHLESSIGRWKEELPVINSNGTYLYILSRLWIILDLRRNNILYEKKLCFCRTNVRISYELFIKTRLEEIPVLAKIFLKWNICTGYCSAPLTKFPTHTI